MHRTIYCWTFCHACACTQDNSVVNFYPSMVTTNDKIQQWGFCQTRFYHHGNSVMNFCWWTFVPWSILLQWTFFLKQWTFNIKAHWLTCWLIYLSNWAEMLFKTTLSVPNFHLNTHVLCERDGFELLFWCELTISDQFSSEMFCLSKVTASWKLTSALKLIIVEEEFKN